MRWLDPTAQVPENIAIILSQILALDVGLVHAVWNDLLSGVAYTSFPAGQLGMLLLSIFPKAFPVLQFHLPVKKTRISI